MGDEDYFGEVREERCDLNEVGDLEIINDVENNGFVKGEREKLRKTDGEIRKLEEESKKRINREKTIGRVDLHDAEVKSENKLRATLKNKTIDSRNFNPIMIMNHEQTNIVKSEVDESSSMIISTAASHLQRIEEKHEHLQRLHDQILVDRESFLKDLCALRDFNNQRKAETAKRDWELKLSRKIEELEIDLLRQVEMLKLQISDTKSMLREDNSEIESSLQTKLLEINQWQNQMMTMKLTSLSNDLKTKLNNNREIIGKIRIMARSISLMENQLSRIQNFEEIGGANTLNVSFYFLFACYVVMVYLIRIFSRM